MKKLAILVTAVALTGCGGNDEGSSDEGSSDETLTVYSGREEELVAPLFERFEEETGIAVEVRYGDSAELAATIAEEGDNSPADVFFAQDPGSLGALEERLAELPDDVLTRVDERFRDGDGRWVGTSGRARVLVYNTDELSEDEVPDSVFDLTDPKWKGKIGLPPTNASFQAFVTAMRLDEGDERTREWLEGLKANEPKFYEKNTPTVEAVASGEIELGLVNHYYLYLVKEEQPDAPIENKYLPGVDPGALVSVAGAGILDGAEHSDAAERFVEFLLADAQQRFYTDEAEEAEIPLVDGIAPKEGVPTLDELSGRGPDVDLSSFGEELEQTLELLNETGYTS
ncbi:MAG: iron ABC transporter substrate-binding protein [Actinobacteria bacterium]|nr:iron ABC transporter substrate-binding protein [Actinomycetota bacterium]